MRPWNLDGSGVSVVGGGGGFHTCTSSTSLLTIFAPTICLIPNVYYTEKLSRTSLQSLRTS